jgi:hypothetical protein
MLLTKDVLTDFSLAPIVFFIQGDLWIGTGFSASGLSDFFCEQAVKYERPENLSSRVTAGLL